MGLLTLGLTKRMCRKGKLYLLSLRWNSVLGFLLIRWRLFLLFLWFWVLFRWRTRILLRFCLLLSFCIVDFGRLFRSRYFHLIRFFILSTVFTIKNLLILFFRGIILRVLKFRHGCRKFHLFVLSNVLMSLKNSLFRWHFSKNE